mmetsp:Transcript_14977/g.39797  ORF Transcript_14977/g.39797 Transcript_14977/m.39797 type:complete len:212 (+) Transcript_14977:307-942(+)
MSGFSPAFLSASSLTLSSSQSSLFDLLTSSMTSFTTFTSSSTASSLMLRTVTLSLCARRDRRDGRGRGGPVVEGRPQGGGAVHILRIDEEVLRGPPVNLTQHQAVRPGRDRGHLGLGGAVRSRGKVHDELLDHAFVEGGVHGPRQGAAQGGGRWVHLVERDVRHHRLGRHAGGRVVHGDESGDADVLEACDGVVHSDEQVVGRVPGLRRHP